MNLRHVMLRRLHATPRFRGRDRLIGAISESFLPRAARLPNGLIMDVDAAEWGQLALLTAGANEPATLRLFERLLVPGDVVFDIGAHVGHHALVAARTVGETGKVFAFDPQPYNADRICRNAELNGVSNIVVVCAAAGERDGFLRVPFQSARDRSRLSLVEKGPNDLATRIEVPVRRLDTFISEHALGEGKLLKIDVEGYELEVIRGLGDRITSFTNIVFEVLDDADVDNTRCIVDILTAARFSLRDIQGNAWMPGRPLLERNVWAALG